MVRLGAWNNPGFQGVPGLKFQEFLTKVFVGRLDPLAFIQNGMPVTLPLKIGKPSAGNESLHPYRLGLVAVVVRPGPLDYVGEPLMFYPWLSRHGRRVFIRVGITGAMGRSRGRSLDRWLDPFINYPTLNGFGRAHPDLFLRVVLQLLDRLNALQDVGKGIPQDKPKRTVAQHALRVGDP